MYKRVQLKPIGMNRDLSDSSFNSQFAFENRNIRISPIEGNTLLSIVNEKGTLPLNTEGENILGSIVGYSVIKDILVLFTTDPLRGDTIYSATFKNDDTLSIEEVYNGRLGLSTKYPLETISIYENENNIKVYWTDGVNQPRVINIKDTNALNDNSFDFIPKINNLGDSKVHIKKNYTSGTFPSGTIQYCFTYYNKNRQETNIVEVSPLYYTSEINRGGSPEENVSSSFTVSFTNVDTSFEYIRLYSILRTSINATPLCKVVADLKIDTNMSIIDTGNIGYTIDPSDLLFVGGEVIAAGTFTQKDNTLFLGNLSVEKFKVDDITTSDGESIKELVQKENVIFVDNEEGDNAEFVIAINNGSIGEYPYKSQLDNSSRNIKIFKHNETYRLGLQFQHETGKWSSPVWVGDATNNIKPKGLYDTEDTILVSTGKPLLKLSNQNLISALLHNGYKAVRPLVVYPTDNDRSCICQGVINPTVFNIGDRDKGTTYSQASWYFRPKLPYEIRNLDFDDFLDFSGKQEYSSNSIGGILTTEDFYLTVNPDNGWPLAFSPEDAWTEFRHHYFIPHNRDTRAEIQGIEQYPNSTVLTADDVFYTLDEVPFLENKTTLPDVVEYFPEMYTIDSALVTLNSPEVEIGEMNEGLLNNTKLRYVGIIPITGNTQDIDIIASTPGLTNNQGDTGAGFQKILYNKPNLNRLAGRRKLASSSWKDYLSKIETSQDDFITYPWHREGSLNSERQATDGYRSALLKNQKRSNLFYSTNSIYLDKGTEYEPKSPSLFRDESIKYVEYPVASEYDNIVYRGNIEQTLLPKFIDSDTPLVTGNWVVRKSTGYSIVTSGNRKFRYVNAQKERYGIDPMSIKYKSTPHIVIDHGFRDYGDYTARIITPIIGNDRLHSPINDESIGDANNATFYGSTKDVSDIIDVSSAVAEASNNNFTSTPGYSWLWLAELYRDIPKEVRFGGTSEQAIENNNWLVAGDTYKLEELLEGESINILWKEGDHYYQRYDCLKTYPYTLEDTNSVVEILSFMCETRVNLDGRYDKNRGKSNNLVMTPTNFNLINNAYSQSNNFFNYRVISKQYAEIERYLNQITWSKTKTFGEEVDTWTNITLASILDLDGDKGRVESLKRLNNDIIAFQETGISHILYNDNMQISTTQGVPIEIANSGKVQGKRYLSTSVGCNNKWSICESPSGLYFIDDNTKGIYLFNGNLTNLTTKLGFSTWARENFSNLKKFTIEDTDNFISYYDPELGEVLFISNKECLAYSESLGTFTSFYDYRNHSLFARIKDSTLLFGRPPGSSNVKFYKYHEGEYNKFYEDYKPFYTEVLVNPDSTKDKIFNNIEFRSNTYDGDSLLDLETFDSLRVYNEYQDTGDTSLLIKQGVPSIMKKKFRIWRINIPRDKKNARDRIRNPWIKIKLSKNSQDSHKTVLHDIVVDYFD